MEGNGFLLDGREVNITDNAEWDTNNFYGDDEDDRGMYEYNSDPNKQEAYNENDEDDIAAPVMPQDFYCGFDSFLNKPPPKLGDIATKADDRVGLAPPSLEVLKKERDDLLKQQRLDPDNKKKAKSISIENKQATGKNKSKLPFNENLLREALEYTEKLLREHNDTEDESDPSSNKISKGPKYSIRLNNVPEDSSNNNRIDNPVRRRGGSMDRIQKKKGLVKKLRTQTKISSEPLDFNTSSNNTELDMKRSPIDYDALVANFEQGLTLKMLKAELEESQRNMARSQEAMKKMMTYR